MRAPRYIRRSCSHSISSVPHRFYRQVCKRHFFLAKTVHCRASFSSNFFRKRGRYNINKTKIARLCPSDASMSLYTGDSAYRAVTKVQLTVVSWVLEL